MHSTNNLEDGYMGSGKRLRRSIRKYGLENHSKEILEFFDSRELLIEAEKTAITPEMLSDKDCMNLMCGGKGGFISDEQQRHRSKCAAKASVEKLKTDDEWRKRHASIASNKMKRAHQQGKIKYNTFTGKKHTEETKKLMSQIRSEQSKGEGNSQYGTCWVTKDNMNKKIKKQNLDDYLNDGWSKGRKI